MPYQLLMNYPVTLLFWFFSLPQTDCSSILFLKNVTQKQQNILCVFETPVCNHIAFYRTILKLVCRSYLGSQMVQLPPAHNAHAPAAGCASLPSLCCADRWARYWPYQYDSTSDAGNVSDHTWGRMAHGRWAHRNCSLSPLDMALGRHKEAKPVSGPHAWLRGRKCLGARGC